MTDILLQHDGPVATVVAKQLINAAEGEDAAAALEILAGSLVSYTDDLKEGVAAALEGRDPYVPCKRCNAPLSFAQHRPHGIDRRPVVAPRLLGAELPAHAVEVIAGHVAAIVVGSPLAIRLSMCRAASPPVSMLIDSSW